MKKVLFTVLKMVAPVLGGGASYLVLATDLLAGSGIPGWLVQLVGVLLGLGGVGPWLDYALKHLLAAGNIERWEVWAGGKVDALGNGIGVIITGGMSRFKLTAKFWNSTLEPWFIIFIKALFSPLLRFLPGLFRGLLSDNNGGAKE